MANSSLALVLSGGSVRAAAHVGVLKALEEFNLRPDLLVGTSGGSIVAALYGAGMAVSDLEELFVSFIDRKDEIVDPNWLGLLEGITKKQPEKMSGLVKGDALEKLIERSLVKAKTFKELANLKGVDPAVSSVMIPSVNLNDGKETIFADLDWLQPIRLDADGEYKGYRLDDQVTIAQAVRASISIPGVFVPARLQDFFVDGGVRDGYPLGVAVKLGKAKQIIGVNLGYAGMRRDGIVERGPAEIISQSLDIMMMGQYKDILHDDQVQASRIITMNPLIYDISTFELEYIPEMITRGYQVAKKMMKDKGLVQGGLASRNRQLLFGDIKGETQFPPKGSPYFNQLLKNQIKDKKPAPVGDDSLARMLARIINKLRLAGALVVSSFILSSGGLLLWIINQSSWITGVSLLALVGVSGLLVYHKGNKVVATLMAN